MSGHHLILGELKDYLTGETLPDTLDERYRQQLARLLVESKGFLKSDLTPRVPLPVRAARNRPCSGSIWRCAWTTRSP